MPAPRILWVIAFLLSFGAHASPLSAPLKEANSSLIGLLNWKFQPDPNNSGANNGWAENTFDDSGWPTLIAQQPWQDQGFPNYQGVAWYRIAVPVPQTWAGSKMLLQADGVREEYDVYINGRFIRHFGSLALPTGDVPTQFRIDTYIKPGQTNVIALRVMDHGGPGGVWRRTQFRRVPPFEKYRSLLPTPIADGHPDLVNLYWNAWEMAWEKISFGNAQNGFVPAYMEEGYDDLIYQWDSIFISMYGRYGRRLFPAMAALDNFYSKQEPDGYIQRIYSKTTGQKVMDPAPDYTLVNPPLFAWSEWDYFRITGDASRLRRVFPILERYDAWIVAHASSAAVPGMFWQTGFDSGMDNMPRPGSDHSGWVDMTLQEVLVGKYLAKIAHQIGLTEREKHWTAVFNQRREAVNRLAWSETDGIYYDVMTNQKFSGVRHIGAFWAMISGAADSKKTERLVQHLKDPKEFYRPHLFPALSASDPDYSPTASYWRGGVWASTNYMVIRGLKLFGYDTFAREAALNHLDGMAKVYAANLDDSRIDPNELDGPTHTIWECYNPEQFIPCTRADAYYFGRQSFAGWSALGPIALMIEDVIGLKIIGVENRVVWRLNDSGRIGLDNFDLGPSNRVSLVAKEAAGSQRKIDVDCRKAFVLDVISRGHTYHFAVPPGRSRFVLSP